MLEIILFTIISVLLLWYFSEWNRKSQKVPLPPGPRPWPLLGNIFTLAKENNVFLTFRALRQQYGDVFSLKIGPTNMIVFNGYDTLREIFVNKADLTSERPDIFVFREISKYKGIAGSSGALWKEHRSFAITTLRKFGFGKKSLESRILDEVTSFLEYTEDHCGKCIDPKYIVQASVSNILCAIVFGERFELTDKRFKQLLEILNFNFEHFKPIVNFMPILDKIPGDPVGTGTIRKNVKKAMAYFREYVEEHKRKPGDDRDYIGAFLTAQASIQDPESSTFTEDQLLMTAGDLFSAGTDTTSTAICWAFLYLLHYPDVAQTMRKEIDEVIGHSRLPKLEDRDNMPYTEAVIHELLRMANVAPLSVPHGVKEEFTFRGYRIPKDAVLIPNLDSVLFDPENFKDPDRFDPNRFMNDGKFVRNEKLLPFSIGRRACIGETLAKMELFLFLTSIFQRFDIHAEDPQTLPELKGILGMTYSPKPYKLIFVQRE